MFSCARLRVHVCERLCTCVFLCACVCVRVCLACACPSRARVPGRTAGRRGFITGGRRASRKRALINPQRGPAARQPAGNYAGGVRNYRTRRPDNKETRTRLYNGGTRRRRRRPQKRGRGRAQHGNGRISTAFLGPSSAPPSLAPSRRSFPESLSLPLALLTQGPAPPDVPAQEARREPSRTLPGRLLRLRRRSRNRSRTFLPPSCAVEDEGTVLC